MLTKARKAQLLERLGRDGQLQVGPLAAEFGLSEDTLRRDLRELASEGKLIRVHGGAVPASPTHVALDIRRGILDPEKMCLAERAAGLISDGMVVIVDGGTTHQHLAAHVPTDRLCTIVTHSPAVATSFEFHQGIEVMLIGGRLFRHSMVALGPTAARSFASINADLCLLGLTGLHPQLGLTTGDSDEAALKQIMLEAAAETVVLATPDKIGRASRWKIADLTALTALVSNGPRPDWLPPEVSYLDA